MAMETLPEEWYLLSLVRRNDHQELRKAILQEDGTLKEGVENQTYINSDGEEEPLLGRLLSEACDGGCLECACILADCCGETVINQLYRKSWGSWECTPLHMACRHDNIDIAKHLVKCKAKVDKTDSTGDLPVHDAADTGHLEVVKYLLDVQPDMVSVEGRNGRTPLGKAVFRRRADCVRYLLEVTWTKLAYDEAKEIVEEARRIAQTGGKTQALDLIETSLIREEFGIEGYTDPTELIANVCGVEGSGKSTFIASFTAEGFFNKLLRQENQPDLKAKDLASRTKGIEETIYNHSQVKVHFRDFAGQEHYTESHDIFTVAMTAPSVAAIVVDGTEVIDEITQTVSATAANIVCRLSAPDDGSLQTEQQDQQHHQHQQQTQQQQHQEELQQAQRLDVIAIATRADKLTPEECAEVEKAIKRGMKAFSQHLDLCFVRVVDARKSDSSSMNDLRRLFMSLVNRVLTKSPKQPRLLQKARKHLDEVQASMPNPYCSRDEFVLAFHKAIQGTSTAPRERFADRIDRYLRILSAYGYVITFPELNDLVVHQPRWLLQDVIGFMYSSNVFPHRPDGSAREYKMSEEEFVRSLTSFAKVGKNAPLCVRMVLQLGLSIRYQKDILALSLFPECTQPLKVHRAFMTSQVMVGSVYTCNGCVPFSSGLIVQCQARVYDYSACFFASTDPMFFKNTIIVHPYPHTTALIVFSSDRQRCCIAVTSSYGTYLQVVHHVHWLFQDLFLDLLKRYSRGTSVERTVLSLSSMRQLIQQSASPAAICPVVASYLSEAVILAASSVQSKDVKDASGVFVDSVQDLHHVPATHVSMLPATCTDRLESLRDSAFLSDLQSSLDVSEREISRLGGPQSVSPAGPSRLNASLVLLAWCRQSHRHTSTVLYSRLAQHCFSSPFSVFYREICRMLVENENMLMEAFPDIITYEQRQLKEQERLRCQADNVPLADDWFSSAPKTSFLGQNPSVGMLRSHLHAMRVTDKLIVDSDHYTLVQEAEAAAAVSAASQPAASQPAAGVAAGVASATAAPGVAASAAASAGASAAAVPPPPGVAASAAASTAASAAAAAAPPPPPGVAAAAAAAAAASAAAAAAAAAAAPPPPPGVAAAAAASQAAAPGVAASSAATEASESTDNPFETATFTAQILPKLCTIPCSRFRSSVQRQGLLQRVSEIVELIRLEKYEPVEHHHVKVIMYIQAGGMDTYEKLCAAIQDLKYEVLYREMTVLLPADRQPRDD
ncbi:uncharacterized protein LOC135819301 isoform X2 [Sycon ciliatum]|uniref:uncharacterized protein LOC135819301 isoform X2 n=1 Tax=Sycon ciliatum TaxID=27933 RepID=UPI0031F6E3E9